MIWLRNELIDVQCIAQIAVSCQQKQPEETCAGIITLDASACTTLSNLLKLFWISCHTRFRTFISLALSLSLSRCSCFLLKSLRDKFLSQCICNWKYEILTSACLYKFPENEFYKFALEHLVVVVEYVEQSQLGSESSLYFTICLY